MLNKKFRKLIFKEIDGTNSLREKTLLQKYLHNHPEAEKLYKQQMEVSKFLADIPSVSPPADIRNNIMNAIDLNRYKDKVLPSRTRTRSPHGKSLFSPKMVFAFTGGLVVGIFLLLLVFLEKREYYPSASEFIGTIGMHAEGRFESLSKININTEDVSGIVQITQYNKFVGCEINVKANTKYELILEYDPARNEFYGIKPVGNIKISLEKGGSYVRSANLENVHFLLFFNRKTSAATQLDLTVSQKGIRIYTHTIQLEPLSPKDGS